MSDHTPAFTRRDLGRLLGLQALAAPALALPVVRAAQPQPIPVPGVVASTALSRGAFVSLVVEHFGWVHSSQFVDAYKAVQPTFTDVQLGITAQALQIETALEEGVLDLREEAFHPQRLITRAEAMAILARAWRIELAQVPGADQGRVNAPVSDAQARMMLAQLARTRVAPRSCYASRAPRRRAAMCGCGRPPTAQRCATA